MVSHPALLLLCAVALSLPMMHSARAECSDERVGRLVKRGDTPKKIAETCKMDLDEIKEIIAANADREPEVTDTSSRGKPDNTPLGPCACWGMEVPGKRPNSNCASGYAEPRICGPACAQGGYAWQGVCTR